MSKKFKTVCFVGFTGGISTEYQNPMAHGGIKLCQARKVNGRMEGRYVNTNGRHEEVGIPFDLTDDQYKHWVHISKCTK